MLYVQLALSPRAWGKLWADDKLCADSAFPTVSASWNYKYLGVAFRM